MFQAMQLQLSSKMPKYRHLKSDNLTLNYLLVLGASETNDWIFQIFDDKKCVWHPYLKLDSKYVPNFGYPICRLGKFLYSITSDPASTVLKTLDLELKTEKIVTRLPIYASTAAVLGENIYITKGGKIYRIETLDETFSDCGVTFSRDYSDDRGDTALVACAGKIIGLSHTICEVYDPKTETVCCLEQVPKLPSWFNATSWNDMVIVSELRQTEGTMLVYTPETNKWTLVLPNYMSPVMKHYNDFVVHEEKIVSLTTDGSVLAYQPIRNTWQYLCKRYKGPMRSFISGFSVGRQIVKGYVV